MWRRPFEWVGDTKAITPPDIRSRKGGTPLICLTAYTTPIAKLVNRHCSRTASAWCSTACRRRWALCSIMIVHGRALRRGLERALMVVDIPFGSYEGGDAERIGREALAVSERARSRSFLALPCVNLTGWRAPRATCTCRRQSGRSHPSLPRSSSMRPHSSPSERRSMRVSSRGQRKTSRRCTRLKRLNGGSRPPGLARRG